MNHKKETPVIPPKAIFIGDENAPVTLTEFADYETESAGKVHEMVKTLLQEYAGKLRFNFRHFPLMRIHQKAHKAAEAAIGAAQEGRFLPMHEILLKNRRQLGTISLHAYAREAGITNKQFLQDLLNGKWGWQVQDDLAEGLRLGVREVPAFFINGKKMEGAPSLRKLKAEVEEALQEKEYNRTS